MLSNVVLIKSGTDEENERANQRMIDCLTEEKKNQCQINTHILMEIKSTFADVLFCYLYFRKIGHSLGLRHLLCTKHLNPNAL